VEETSAEESVASRLQRRGSSLASRPYEFQLILAEGTSFSCHLFALLPSKFVFFFLFFLYHEPSLDSVSETFLAAEQGITTPHGPGYPPPSIPKLSLRHYLIRSSFRAASIKCPPFSFNLHFKWIPQ
jgi:hypothetical protein